LATIWGAPGVFAQQVQQGWERQAAQTQQQAQQLDQQAQQLDQQAQQLDRLAQQLGQQAGGQRLLRAAWTRHRARAAARSAQAARASAQHQRDLRERYEQQADEQLGSARAAQAGVMAELGALEALASCPGVQDLVCGLQLGPAGGDIDIVALGARPLVVEVKAGFGPLRLEGTQVLHGDKPIMGDPLEQLARQIRVLREAGVPEVVGVLALPQASGGVQWAPDGTPVAGGIPGLRQAAAQLLGPPRQHTFGPQQLFQALDWYLAQLQRQQQDKLRKVQRRLAYRDMKCREWNQKLAQWATWNNANGARMKATLRAKLQDAAIEQANDMEYAQRLAQQYSRWEQARQQNAALQQIRQVG